MFSRLMGKKKPDLWRASLQGDLQSVRAALAGGQSANSRGGPDLTCLMAAVRRGHKEVVTELLQQEDCDLSLEDINKWTALHLACCTGRVGMVRQLASHPRQGSLNSKDCDGDTAIMFAVYRGEAECVLALGRLAGVELDTRYWEGWSLEVRARCGGGVVEGDGELECIGLLELMIKPVQMKYFK
jgi:hypothetical protein